MINLNATIKLLRPKQWSKNVFIFLPVFSGGQLMNFDSLFNTAIGVFIFCLVASCVYCFNDLIDVSYDKSHPTKCKRPVASGAISPVFAVIILIILLLFSFSLAFFICKAILPIISIYFLMNILYCLKLKKYAIIDVFIIGIGFVLRVFAGGLITNIYISEWIVLLTFILALFLGFAKRRDDVLIFQRTGTMVRANTSNYNLSFLDSILSIFATIIILTYLMYTTSKDVMDRLGNNYLYLTSIFVIGGILRYLQLAHVKEKTGSPTNILWKDYFIQFNIIAWIISFFYIIYL